MDRKQKRILNEYLESEQDFNDDFWKDEMHIKLYLKAKRVKLHYLDADRYVYLYDLLGYDIGIKKFRKINSDMWEKYNMELFEAYKEKNNEEWQIICQMIEGFKM